MKKLISISTTTRSPYRVKEQLPIFKQYFDGKDWSDQNNQLEFFIRLVQHRLYDPTRGSSNPMPEHLRLLFDSNKQISFDEAKSIVHNANYDDVYRRGRTAIDTQFKLGFLARHKEIIKITPLGHELLDESINDTVSFLKALLKWQLPNEKQKRYYKKIDGYSTIPLISTIKLINNVNKIQKNKNLKTSGISKKEFNIFATTLINFNDINEYSKKLISFREKYETIEDPEEKRYYIDKYLISNFNQFDMNNAKDYGDNLRRYFLYTGLFRDNGFYFNLKEDRADLINQICKLDNKILDFKNLDDFYNYIGTTEVDNLFIPSIEKNNPNLYFSNYEKAKTPKFIQETLNDLESLKNREFRYGSGIDAERFFLKFLYILNTTDNIRSNSPSFDEEGYPIATAPALQPDLQSLYKDFALLGEVTTITSRNQIRESEMQSVSRHARNFENNNEIQKVFLIFLAPIIHRDVLNQFHYYTDTRGHGYEGRSLNIIPLSYEQIEKLLLKFKKIYSENIEVSQDNLKDLFEKIVKFATNYNSTEWSSKISQSIDEFLS